MNGRRKIHGAISTPDRAFLVGGCTADPTRKRVYHRELSWDFSVLFSKRNVVIGDLLVVPFVALCGSARLLRFAILHAHVLAAF